MKATSKNEMQTKSPNANTTLPFLVSREIREGRVLAGDDLPEEQLAIWFAQEQEAFYEQDSGNSNTDPWYAYMMYVNEKLGFSSIERSKKKQGSMLILGPGSGREVERFAEDNSGWLLHFLEASSNFRTELQKRWPSAVILEPGISGDIALSSGSQDVVCAFSVLHHIPNVSKVVREVYRVTKPGGFFLVREPCSSMGDWRYSRPTTPNERGISCSLLMRIAGGVGFSSSTDPVPILFEPINKVLKRTIGFSVVPFSLLYWCDRIVSRLLARNDYYWRDGWYKKLGPSSYFYIFRKSP